MYKLDLLERDPGESMTRLRRYLDFQAIVSGTAIDAARDDYRSIAKEREIRRTLPDAWQKLISEGNAVLVDLVAERVESLCGFRPDPDVVVEFLSTTRSDRSNDARSLGVKSKAPRTTDLGEIPVRPLAPSANPLGMGFSLYGQSFSTRRAIDVLLMVFRTFAERDPGFPDRFAARTAPRRRRRYLARSREALFPGNAALAADPSYSRELSPASGWWVDTNPSRRSIEQIIRMACEVAGIGFGVDLTVRLE